MTERIIIAAAAIIAAIAADAAPMIPANCHQYRAAFAAHYPAVARAVYVAQVWKESACRADAKSPVGAQGLAQFMPATARDVASRNPQLSPPAPFAPEWSLTAQVWYMRQQLRRLRGDTPCAKWAMSLAAYNSGAGWVLRAKRRAAREGHNPYRWFGSVEITPDRRHRASAVRENRDYVRRILTSFAPAAARQWQLSSPPECPK